MSISVTLSNALTGLTASSRSAQIVSNNVANALTEGYARREIELSARGVGGVGAGVTIDGVRRIVDENVLRERRLSSAALSNSTEKNNFFQTAINVLGEPQDPASMVARAAEFDRALLAATSRPESDAVLFDVLNAAKSLVQKFNDASNEIQQARMDADRAIGRDVRFLNASLEQIAELNAQILRAKGTDQDYPSLLDNRQRLVDEISGLVPIRQLSRENDTIALYTSTGALLVDVYPSTFEFQETSPITADMTIASGALSALTVNGTALDTVGENSPMAGGKLASLFAVRDELAPDLQSNIDALAYDLISRFEDPTLDTSLTPGDPGLFTDNGGALNPANTIGLADRLELNSLVNPDNGGELWRLRDGLGAAAPGPVGDASLLAGIQQRLGDVQASVGGTLPASDRTFSNFADDITSLAGQSSYISEQEVSFEQARFTGLNEAILADGVDTDQELQELLLIEQAYAANARVIRTADELIQLLIGL